MIDCRIVKRARQAWESICPSATAKKGMRRMDLVDLLQSDEANLPRGGELDAETQLARMFKAYFAQYRKLSAADQASALALHHVERSERLGAHVLAALGAWLDGHPSRALNELSAGLADAHAALVENTSVPVDADEIGPLYRLRGTPDLTVARAGLFHLPFEAREHVATARYSFPGLPCLYFGRSSYICWVECGRPKIDTVWISRFRLSEGSRVRLLDFGRSPAVMAAMLADAQRGHPHHPSVVRREQMAAAYATLWPLIAASSLTRRAGSDAKFVVEYVIPQLLLRWLIEVGVKPPWAREHLIEGIRYFSTRVDADAVNVAAMNYVFPTLDRAPTGVCPTLRRKYTLTEPVLWTRALASDLPPTKLNADVKLDLGSGSVPYQSTDYARVDGYLDSLPSGALP
jgi:hypothetical protein